MKNKKLIFSLAAAILVFCIIFSILIFILVRNKDNVTKNVDQEASQEPIKGPDVGEWGNDFDNTFRSLAISPTDQNVVYIGNEGNGIFRSTNGGLTWEWLRNGLKHYETHYPEIYEIAIDENNEETVLAATTNGPSPIYSEEYNVPVTAGIYRSKDQGDTWVQYTNGLPNSAVVSLVQIPSKSDTFIVGLDGLQSSRDNYKHIEIYGGLYISQDSGKNWESLPIPEEGIQNRYSKLIVRNKKNPVIYTSGLKWTEEEGSSHSKPDREGSIGLLRGDDNGKTWTKINPENAFVLYFDASSDGKTIYAGDLDTGYLYVSNDRGETWNTIQASTSGPLKIHPNDNKKVLYSQGKDLYLTEDGFNTNRKVLTVTQGVNDIEYFKANPKIIYASGGGFEVYRSLDGGYTFQKVGDLREFIENNE